MLKTRVPIGYKFILGFIAVVAAVAFVPDIIDGTGVVEWLRQPLSFLTAIVIGLVLGSEFVRKRLNQEAFANGDWDYEEAEERPTFERANPMELGLGAFQAIYAEANRSL